MKSDEEAKLQTCLWDSAPNYTIAVKNEEIYNVDWLFLLYMLIIF